MPKLHIIAAGSLLGVALRQEGVSFPVGKVDRIDMYPMSFEEFVNADGGGNISMGSVNSGVSVKYRNYILYHWKNI